jgi:hypothetical protein
VTYRQSFIDELTEWKRGWPSPVRVMDTPAHPGNLLADLGEGGFTRAAFYLNTNLETGWFLPQPGLALVDQIRRDDAVAHYDEIVTMRIEVETRWVQDALVAAALDHPTASIEAVVATVAEEWAGDVTEGAALARGILAWDDLLYRGAKASDAVVSTHLASVTGSHSTMPERIALLKSCGLVVDGLAAEARGARGSGGAARAARSAMRADPVLAPLIPTLESSWDRFVGWVAAGTTAEQF